MTAPLLWHFAISHFTEKARWALDFKGIAHRRRELFLDYPIRVPLRTGQMKLPVLFDADRTVVDSTRIIAHLEERWPDPPLYPANPEALRRALALEDFFDEQLGPHVRAVVVDRLFAHGPRAVAEVFGMTRAGWTRGLMRAAQPVFRPFYRHRHRMGARDVALGREKIAQAVERLEKEIGSSGHLVGDRFCVADLTAAALFYPLAMPAEYPYPPPPIYAEAIAEIAAPLEGRPALDWVRETYRRHRGVSAAIEG